jgi:hypothetical protein
VALAGLCFAAVAAPAHAGVFEASAGGIGYEGGSGPPDSSPISLPQYAGPGTITSVTLTFNGDAGGTRRNAMFITRTTD